MSAGTASVCVCVCVYVVLRAVIDHSLHQGVTRRSIEALGSRHGGAVDGALPPRTLFDAVAAAVSQLPRVAEASLHVLRDATAADAHATAGELQLVTIDTTGGGEHSRDGWVRVPLVRGWAEARALDGPGVVVHGPCHTLHADACSTACVAVTDGDGRAVGLLTATIRAPQPASTTTGAAAAPPAAELDAALLACAKQAGAALAVWGVSRAAVAAANAAADADRLKEQALAALGVYRAMAKVCGRLTDAATVTWLSCCCSGAHAGAATAVLLLGRFHVLTLAA